MVSYRLALAVSIGLLFHNCDSKIIVDKVNPGTVAKADGMIYALPNTVVRVQVKIDKTVKTGAPFVKYAAIFAGDKTPLCKAPTCTPAEATTYSLQDGSTFSTYGEPDPNNVFLVRFAGGGAIDQDVSMTWNDVGLLSAASSTVSNRTGDILLSVLKAAADLGTRGFALRETDQHPELDKCEQLSSSDEWILPIIKADPFFADALIENYCKIKKEDRDLFSRNTDKDPLQAAYNAYVARVGPLLKSRNGILTSQTRPNDPTALLLRIESEIDRQIAKLYLGIKNTSTWDGALDVRRLKVSTKIPLLKIEPSKGICLADSEVPPVSKPLPSEFTLNERDCSAAAPVFLKLEYYPASDKQLFTKIVDSTEGDRSFRYRVAAQVSATLADEKENDIYGSGVFSVAQLGKVISLPASHHSKTLTYDLTFIEATGALKTFKLGTVGLLDSATVDALSGVGGKLLDSRKTEVDTLTLQYQLLKLKDDICTIQTKYNIPCTVQP
jgi:hypothetical protein